jgi:NAD(P)-dependent dehydrogenase (short-subunit alcohol dehydrogenase family)
VPVALVLGRDLKRHKVGHPELLDYTATKGAMVALMRALSNQIVGEKGIRVNGPFTSLPGSHRN